MYNLVKQNVLQKKLIFKGETILVALSGGPDSVFLFHNLRKLKEILGFNLYASHINHMYRGEDAMHDEEFARNLCKKYGIRLFVKRKHAGEYARELKVTEEEAGRILRYGFFNENLDELGGGKIAVAHNLNDQAETVLQRLIRGTGVDGLSAMSFENNNIIRPILNVPKSEILKYLHDNSYEYCIDKTNLHDIYGRNKIRLNLIPYLEENFNPNIQNVLYRMSEAMQRDKKIIEKYTELKFQELLVEKDAKRVVLNLSKLKSLKPGESGRIVKRAIEELKGNTINIEMKHINYMLGFMQAADTGKKINLTEGFTTEISYDNFIINKNVENIPNFEYNIILNDSLYIPEVGKTLTVKILNITEFDRKNRNSISLDYGLLRGNPIVRNRRPGDSMIPCGMSGKKKIKDVFIDLKIPAAERDKKLIIEAGGDILWLEGFRINNSYKVSDSTKKILNITMEEQH